MNLLSGLEKFGLNGENVEESELFSEKAVMEVPKQEEGVKKEVNLPKEEDFLLDKSITCPICDKVFLNKSVKNSKLRRKEPDKDLRPRFQYIDTLKYDVLSCPYCGYTAMSRYHTHVSPLQRKMILEGVGAKFKKVSEEQEALPPMYDYDTAIDRYKLALYNTIVKKGAVSEKAYTCLKIAWLYRGKCEELLQLGEPEDSENIRKNRKEERTFYEQAYEGFVKAVASESTPICGMDQNTLDILIAEMAFYLGKYDIASRYVSGILVSHTANRHTKDKALELKEEILAAIHNGNQA